MSDERQDFATPESVHAAMRRAGGVVTADPRPVPKEGTERE